MNQTKSFDLLPAAQKQKTIQAIKKHFQEMDFDIEMLSKEV